MTDQAAASVPLSSVVADATAGAALALRGEGGAYVLSRLLGPTEHMAPAAVRVLGADALAPYALAGEHRAGEEDAAVVREALTAYAPGRDASEVSVWSYRGLVEAARAHLPAIAGGWPPPPPAEAAWIAAAPWPQLSHRIAQLAALALPGLADDLAAALAPRTDDLARGFVRAVRRRDWPQAAGVGRWLARLPQTPPSLGLDNGLSFVLHMSGGDPRVILHAEAARRFYGRGR